MTRKEEWRPFFHRLYQVSNMGHIRRLVHGEPDRVANTIQPYRMRTGLLAFKVRAHGQKKGFLVHRIVAECFLGNLTPSTIVRHKDGNRDNNCVDNLEYTTRSDITRKGVGSCPIKLDKQKVKEILMASAAGENAMSLADKYGCSQPTILSVIHRKSWKHVP